jgi:hypothetical protein
MKKSMKVDWIPRAFLSPNFALKRPATGAFWGTSGSFAKTDYFRDDAHGQPRANARYL